MGQVLFAQVRANAARLVASMLAIVIAVAFVVATLVLNATSRATLLDALGAQYVGTGAVVTSSDGSSLADDVATLTALPLVADVAPTWETSVQAVLPDRSGAQYVLVDSVADAPALRWQRLAAGALPQAPGEIAVSQGSDAALGDVVPVTSFDAEGVATTSEVTVVGIVDLRGDPTAGLYARAWASTDQVRAWGATQPTELRVAGWNRVVPDALAAQVRAALPPTAEVQTGTQAADARVAELTGNAAALAAVLLVFATVAVLVAGLVIANTFAVLLAQRTRELALLRCVGATAGQVRRSVLGEALVTGLAASVVGVLAGVGLAAGISAAVGTDSPIPLSGVSVPLVAVLAGLLVGTVVTVVAALAPAHAATRVAPLAALRPQDPAPLRSRSGVLRLALGTALLLSGVALLAVGVLSSQVLVALPGGVLSSLGVLVLAQRALPPVVAAAGRLAGRLGGVPGRLAAGNATRNPRRTAATATALLIGVSLTTAMVVGAASTRATVTAELAAVLPTDVVVQGGGTPVPASLLGRLEGVDGVAAGLAVQSAPLVGPDGSSLPVEAVDATQAGRVLRSTAGTDLPVLGEVVLPPSLASAWSVESGEPVTFTEQDRSLTFTAVVGDDRVGTPRLTPVELTALAPDATVSELWLRLADGVDEGAVVDEVSDLASAALPAAQVAGIATERAAIDGVLDVLLLLVTALLGVAVLIALIGVGNTLALSVVERRQESGLLRALGLTRRQLRGVLAWEAVLVAGVAAVLGVLIGGAYGLVGAASVLGGLGDVVLSVPWLQVAAIVGVATLAGLLASVLPGRRAARTAPVAAIAG
ncbi:FtsX-like permease family protein [Modestobacter sp. I12A-02628]|uniref:FtsX-like permease family protein n=1 Tax=Goekera deserti TaxID=2497753 RepID=A0A7K3WJX0_9ACTN|nr:FtsX-like permease family protein [Goekera deserti]MPQ97764.1 FtsX-like permease family protein [Goekera deserti]NDI48409.1 FtsX-like permease family protein [Goekera deserti]NEL56010.1 FtsX-like permease family protein [Goekera deserti]